VGKLRGDLDWIALKALERDRKRRYESPRDIADDIDRYLREEVIEARPPSASYRMSRFVRRHRMAVGLSAVAVIALVGFAVWQTVQSRIIARERDRARANERLSLAREQVELDPTLALAYALSSLELVDQPAAREVARRAFAHDVLRDEIPRRGATGNPLSVDASRDGRWCAVAWSQSERPTVGLYDLRDRSMRRFVAPTRGWAWEVTLTSDAQHLVAIASDGMHVWRTSDGAHLFRIFDEQTNPAIKVFAQNSGSNVLVAWSSPDSRTRWFRTDLPDSVPVELGTSVGIGESRLAPQAPAADPRGRWVFDHRGNDIYAQRVEDLGTDRAVLVGRHPARVNAVAVDPELRFLVSVDARGGVRVWDPASPFPRALRSYDLPPGSYQLTVDAHRPRFLTTWGSETVHLFELDMHPARAPVALLDRSHWTHDGAFLPDGTVITSRNGIRVGPVAIWRPRAVVAWSLDRPDSLGRARTVCFTPDGRWLYEWTESGAVMRHSVVPGGSGSSERVATSPPINVGIGYRFEMNPAQTRCITFNSTDYDGVFVHDLARAERRPITVFGNDHVLMSMSPSGRRAAFVDEYDGFGEDGRTAIVDLDRLEIERTVERDGARYLSMRFVGEDSLLALCTDHLALIDITRADVAPDTLWRGDARRGGLILENAEMVVVLGAERALSAFAPFGVHRHDLGKTSMGRLYEASYSARHGYVAIESGGTSIDVFELATGSHWTIPMPGKGASITQAVQFEPLGRWLVTSHPERTIAWGLPLDPLFAECPGSEFIARVRATTNVRVVPDAQSPVGFRITNTDEES
jgi:WD40 repeat protein